MDTVQRFERDFVVAVWRVKEAESGPRSLLKETCALVSMKLIGVRTEAFTNLVAVRWA